MYKGFLSKFQEFFRIQKETIGLGIGQTSRVMTSKRNYYCWKDKDYRDFIIQILVKLEPFRENKYAKIIEELDEFTILQFVNKGKIQIGFELNNEIRYAL